MDTISLQADKRTEQGKAVRRLRKAGLVPAVAYGHDQSSVMLSLDHKLAERIYRQVGGSRLVQLKIGEGAAKNALIHDVQLDGRTGSLMHLDFYFVRMDEVLKAEVPLHFVGESTAVYQEEGILVKVMESVEVETLPANLPDMLEVDISVLDDFEKTITIADITVPKGVTILAEADELVVKVDPPRSEEELAELDETVTEVLPEGVVEEQVAVKEESGGNSDRKS